MRGLHLLPWAMLVCFTLADAEPAPAPSTTQTQHGADAGQIMDLRSSDRQIIDLIHPELLLPPGPEPVLKRQTGSDGGREGEQGEQGELSRGMDGRLAGGKRGREGEQEEQGEQGVLQRRSTMVYTDEMIASLKEQAEKFIDYAPDKVADLALEMPLAPAPLEDEGQQARPRAAERMNLNASIWHWRCPWRQHPWKIKGGKLGLVYVYTRVQTFDRRAILRTTYAQYPADFDVIFAVDSPNYLTKRACQEQDTNEDLLLVNYKEIHKEDSPNYLTKRACQEQDTNEDLLLVNCKEIHKEDSPNYLTERACQEQETNGDLLLVNCKESHNDGKMYHTVVQLVELLNTVWKGGYKHIIKLDDDSYAHFPNLKTYLTQTYLTQVESKYIGGHWEDWLLGFWMRLYGPHEITDVFMDDEYWSHIEYGAHNVSLMAAEIRSKVPQLCMFHVKSMEDWLFLVEVVKAEKERLSNEALETQVDAAAADHCMAPALRPISVAQSVACACPQVCPRHLPILVNPAALIRLPLVKLALD
eukprot:gene26559-18326_t